MTTTTLPLSDLLPPKGNPRRSVDRATIAGLAQSIRTDGLLQNLVVRPDEDGKFRIVFGKRRHLALQLLKKEGVIGDDYAVPVEIREDLSDGDALRLATVENVQREQMSVLDEAEAFARLLASGGSIEEIANKTGLSDNTVKRRLALANLCHEAKKALRTGVISRGVAEALTVGSAAQQRSMLEAMNEEGVPDPEDIRHMLLEQKPSLAMAIFPKEQYEGSLTTDLFAEDESTYFHDPDQFLALQKEAVERLAEEERKTAAWVDVLTAYSVPWWQYREAEGSEESGVVIHFHPSGAVEVRKGLARQPVNEPVIRETREVPQVPIAKQRPPFSAPLLRYVAHHKSMAVQAALLRNPRKAKEVAVLLLVGAGPDHAIALTVHSCHRSVNGAQPAGSAKAEVDQFADELADRLDVPVGLGVGQQHGADRLLSNASPEIAAAVMRLSDDELDRLIVLLPILCFGQEQIEALDTGDSLFNGVASELGVNMRDWWTPDVTFLTALRRDQLIELTSGCGASEPLAGFKNWTKTELVQGLARFLVSAEEATDDANRQGRQWLPGIMRFPASETL